MSRRFTRGFTLIELLVVIAIIGILASVVLVSLQSARKKGNDARIISNVRSMKTALENNTDFYGKYKDLTPVSRIARYSTVVTNGTMSAELRSLIADTITQQTQAGVTGTVGYAGTDAAPPVIQAGSIIITKDNTNISSGYAIYAKLSDGDAYCMNSSGKVQKGAQFPTVAGDIDTDAKAIDCAK